jgi:hypothetical protein
MPARKREADNWWTDSEASPASGGHIAPNSSAESVLDPLTESQGDDSGSAQERTEVIPTGASADLQRAPSRSRYGRGARPAALRRVRRTLRHVDPLSVLKLSLFYYGCFLVMWLVFVALAYWILSAVGLFDRLERIGRALALWEHVDVTFALVEGWTLLIGLTLAVLGSLVNLFLAFLYNLAADVVGGVDLTFVERDL